MARGAWCSAHNLIMLNVFAIIILAALLFEFIVDAVADALNLNTGLTGLTAAIMLAFMSLPLIISISDDALRAVPDEYREGAYALGATRWQTVSRVVLPAARSGIITAIILGMGRAIGETMAVIMVAGNALQIPTSLLDPVRTLTSNIALELSYAAGRHREALFATGIVLFIIIMILNLSATLITRRR